VFDGFGCNIFHFISLFDGRADVYAVKCPTFPHLDHYPVKNYLRNNRQYLNQFSSLCSRFTHLPAGNSMDITPTDDIRHRLHRYDMAVQEICEHAQKRSSFGQYRAGAPYFEQYPLREVLTSFEGDTALTGALDEYERITRELETVEHAGGRAYREELFRDLCAYTEAYRTMLCYHEMGMDCPEEITDIRIRDMIGILLLELKKDFSLAGIEQEVALLDEAHRNISEAERTVQPAQALSERSTSDPSWQQYPSSRQQKEWAGFR
jgi:hypothetical protein